MYGHLVQVMERELSDEQWGKKIQDVNFWKKRYETHRKGDENFEWYCGYPQIKELFEHRIGIPSIDIKILDLGCGSSTLSVDMSKAGYNVVGLDYVNDHIEYLNRKFNHVENLNFVCADFRDMTSVFPSSTVFDVVMDKGGFDSILASGHVDTAAKTSGQIDILLKGNGHFVCISHSNPETELGQKLLAVVLQNVDLISFRWNVDIHSSSMTTEDDGSGGFHVYIFQKIRRPRTRSVTRALRRNHDVRQDENYLIRRHYH